MDKVNKAIETAVGKVQSITTGSIQTVAEAFTTLIKSVFDAIFAIGGEVSKNTGNLLGVLNDNVARIKNLLDGKSK